MSLQEQIKKDLASAMKAQDDEKKSALRVIMGEFGRLTVKTVNDEETIKILKKLVKSEKEVLSRSGEGDTNRFIEIVESYLPQPVDEHQIRTFIQTQVDFGQYKNKMQAMGAIMKHFGDTADGNLVKKILQTM